MRSHFILKTVRRCDDTSRRRGDTSRRDEAFVSGCRTGGRGVGANASSLPVDGTSTRDRISCLVTVGCCDDTSRKMGGASVGMKHLYQDLGLVAGVLVQMLHPYPSMACKHTNTILTWFAYRPSVNSSCLPKIPCGRHTIITISNSPISMMRKAPKRASSSGITSFNTKRVMV